MRRLMMGFAGSALLLLLASASSGAVTTEPELQPSTERALSLWNEGRSEEAMAELRSAIGELEDLEGRVEVEQRERQREEAYFLLGLIQLSMHDEASAESFAKVDEAHILDWIAFFSSQVPDIFERIAPAPTIRVKPPSQEGGEGAGQARGLVVGRRIRAELSGSGTRIVGSLAAIRDDALVLVSTDQSEIELPRDGIRKLEMSYGRKGHGLMGLLIGAGTGALLGAVEPLDPNCIGEDCYTRGENIGSGALGGGLLGGLIGVFIKTDRWLDAPMESIRVDVRADRGGAGVEITLSF